ncbi:MAG: hypothetical protein K8R41_03740 [Bacteroidales bacterium]|nr:hypothetical protein [Bacteroidales bacterium]
MKRTIKTESIYKIDYVVESINSEEINQKEQKYSYQEFNENGKIILEINYDSFGVIAEKIVRKFDDNSNLIEEIYYDEGEEMAERKTYERDNNGAIKYEYTHYLDGTKDTLSYIFNDEKKIISKILKDDEDYLESTEKFEYKNSKLIKREVFDENNDLIEKEIFEYDNNGNVIEYINQDNDKYNEFRIVNEYDESGNRNISLKYNSRKQLIQKSIFSFNEKNRIIKIIEETPQGITTTHLKYDHHENVIFQEELNANNETISRIEREFDNDGNIIQSNASIDMHGMGMNQNYILKYEYEFFEG